MLWKNHKITIIGFGILFSVFFSVLLSSHSYAIDPISVTYQVNTLTSGSYIFPDCKSASCLTQYSYLKVEVDPYTVMNNKVIYFTYSLRIGGSSRSFYYSVSYPSTNGLVYYFPVNPDLSTYQDHFMWETDNNPVTLKFTLLTELFSCPPVPSGTLSITENGTYDVIDYSEVDVDVPHEVVPGDYHDDLLKINNSILVCGAICLVLYFFYCIYRMIIKSTGGY